MLPISHFLPTIAKGLSDNPSLVLQAEPGAGKSTALPLTLLEAEWLAGKKIVMLEPRRVAARSIAHYLARQLGEKVGQRVGYQVRNDRKVSQDTQLEIITEGILTRRLQSNPELTDTALIIFDEFHERSLHADLALMLALEIQQSLRDDLKLLVMSATIDTRSIASYLGGAPVIECPGRTFPVDVTYTAALKDKRQLAQQVTTELRKVLSSSPSGDVLVFLPGQSEINRCLREAEKALDSSNIELLPLYGALPLAQQERALSADTANPGNRRIIFSTNIAETSLTIEGVTCVIDSGLERLVVYDPGSDMSRLETAYISKASAEQRKGRAGRLQPGSCVRLWDEQKHHSLIDYQPEEILSADLTGLVMELTQWGTTDYNRIHWLTPPPEAHFNSATNTLRLLQLLDDKHRLTAAGKRAGTLGLHPRLAAVLLAAQASQPEQLIACELVALLNERDIFSQHASNTKGADILERMLAIQDYKQHKAQALTRHPIRRAAIEQLLTSVRTYATDLNLMPSKVIFSLTDIQTAVGNLLLHGFPDRIAKQRAANSGRYQLANGRGVFLYEDDPLFNSEWLIVTDADGQKREGRIYSAAPVQLCDITRGLKNNLEYHEEFRYDQVRQKMTGRSVTRFLAVELDSRKLTEIPTEKFQQCLENILKKQAFELLNWNDRCEDWLARATWLGLQVDSFPQLNQSILLNSLEAWLLPYLTHIKSIAQLKKVNVYELLTGALSWEQQQQLEREAPTQYTTPSNKQVSIRYDSQQGPTVSVILQEMFGELESPRIGGGKVPLRFELLSPARRPIQTTSDLANFWRTSYFDLAKDMRGRYPKHRWPEKPLEEKPGRSIKPKGRKQQ